MIGIFIVVMDGLWIVDSYNSYDLYPREALILWIVGICTTLIAYMVILRKRKLITDIKYGSVKELRGTKVQQFVNRMWQQRMSVGNKLLLIFLVLLAVIAIFDFTVAMSLLRPILFLVMLAFSFVYIMTDEDENMRKEKFQLKSYKLSKLLRLIDYREHPFSLGLIIFIIIVLTLLLSKQFGLVLNLETSGNPAYVMSLPSAAFILSGLVFACGFIYIKQHCHFFGIGPSEQSEYKLFQIRFLEIIICGASFLIWLGTIVIDWLIG